MLTLDRQIGHNERLFTLQGSERVYLLKPSSTIGFTLVATPTANLSLNYDLRNY